MLVFPPNPITDYNSGDYRDRNEGTARFLRGPEYYYTPYNFNSASLLPLSPITISKPGRGTMSNADRIKSESST